MAEIKTCEQYVLNELEYSQYQVKKLQENLDILSLKYIELKGKYDKLKKDGKKNG